MMVLDHDPFLGGFDHMAFTALIPVVVAVDACVERVGEHGANGSGVPRFPGPGATAFSLRALATEVRERTASYWS